MDRYAAVAQIKPGKYAGEVRDIVSGRVAVCAHTHKRRSVALNCAEKLLAENT